MNDEKVKSYIFNIIIESFYNLDFDFDSIYYFFINTKYI